MIRFNKILPVLALGALSCISFALDPITLKLTPKEGDQSVYNLTATMAIDASGATANVTGTITNKVTKVNPDGTFEVKTSQGDMTIDLGGGQTSNVPGGDPRVSVRKPDGTIVQLRGENLTPESYRMSALTSFIFPSKALNAGDTWTAELLSDEKTGAVKTKFSYKLDDVEKLNGVDVAKIESSVVEEEGDSPASSKGLVYVRVSDGLLIKATQTWKDVPVPGSPSPVSGQYQIELAPSAAAAPSN